MHIGDQLKRDLNNTYNILGYLDIDNFLSF